MNEKLTEENFLLYAAKHYNNCQCYDTLEFYDDLKRFSYIKRLLNHYTETGELKERLILNHIMVLYNVFGAEPTARMLFLRIKDKHPQLKPFLSLLSILPEKIINIGLRGDNILTKYIPSDPVIEKALKGL